MGSYDFILKDKSLNHGGHGEHGERNIKLKSNISSHAKVCAIEKTTLN